jgi:hypothetical protein
MQDQPTSSELLKSVAEFLRDRAIPQLDAHAAFHARVSANALDIVRREMELGPKAAATEYVRLVSLLKEDGPLLELNRKLSAKIFSGELDSTHAGLITHLWLTTLDKLAIDQPGYESFKRETASD